MKKCKKVLAVLNTFSKQEFKNFELFLISPYFKVPETILLLYNYIKTETEQFNPSIKSVNKSAKEMLQNITPDHVYENEAECDSFLSNLLHKLMQQIKFFFAVESIAIPYTNIPVDIALTFYFEDKPEKHFLSEQHFKKTIEKINTAPVFDYTAFIYNFLFIFYQLKDTKFESPKLNATSVNSKFTKNNTIKTRESEAEKATILAKLRKSMALSIYELEIATKFHLSLLNEQFEEKPYLYISPYAIEHLVQNNFLNKPYLELNYYLLLFKQNPSRELKDKLLTIVEINKKKLHIGDLKMAYNNIINYLSKQITASTSANDAALLRKEHFEIYEKKLKIEDRISAITLKNFVTMGIRCKEFAKTEKGLKELIERLDAPEHTNLVENYNLAQIKFAQGKYDDALKDVQTTISNPNAYVFYTIGTKILEIKCLYELFLKNPNDHTTFEKLNNRIHYLKKSIAKEDSYKTVERKNRTAWQNFLYIVQALLSKKIDNRNNRTIPIQNIKAIIAKNQIISERPWLEEKLKQKDIDWNDLIELPSP